MTIQAIKPRADGSSYMLPGLSLRDAITAVEGWSDLEPTRRRDLKSSLSAAARMAGLPPELIPFTPAALRQHVLNQPAAAVGIKKTSLYNIRSCLSYVAGRLGVIDGRVMVLSPGWTENLERLDQRKRLGLTTLARFCSQGGIEPASLDAAALAACLLHLESDSLTKSPRKLVANARLVWNEAVRDVDGWVGSSLPKQPSRNPYVLPLHAFTQGFRDDLAVFSRGYAGDPFDDAWSPEAKLSDDAQCEPGRSRLPRQISVDLRLSHCRWAASVLVKTGVPIDEITSLRDLVVPVDRAKSIIRFLHDHAKGESAAGMHVAGCLRIIAKYHVRLAAGDIQKIKQWESKVKVVYTDLTIKNRKTMLAAMEPGTMAKILELPELLMRRANALLTTKPKPAASLALRAVLTELLLKHPLRQHNVLMLRLDQHLLRSDPRRAKITAIEIPGEETKNDQPLRLPVSSGTSAVLTHWIDVFRPLFGGGPA